MPRIIIVGAGIVGSCTAYYLTQHRRYDPEEYEVIVIEAVEPGAAASGKAGGLISQRAFPDSLATLSFKLHRRLSREYDGESNWDYRPLHVTSIKAATGDQARWRVHKTSNSASSNSSASNANKVPPKSLDWLDPNVVTEIDMLGMPDMWAQVHPYKFTNFILEKAKTRGVRYIRGMVTKLNGTEDSRALTGISYTEPGNPGVELQLEADYVVIAAGPWTSKLVHEAPIVGHKAHSITMDPPQQVSAFACFSELDIDGEICTPEIYPRVNEIYMCGASQEMPVPDSADQVLPDPGECEQIFAMGGILSPVIRDSRVTRHQACFLPIVEASSSHGPFIGETNVKGLYVAAGHAMWGINNGPGTGLLMSEYILDGEGAPLSAKIRDLNPKLHFDARPALS